MNASYTTELLPTTEHISAVPKPDRRRRRIDVVHSRRAADGTRVTPMVHVDAKTDVPFSVFTPSPSA